MQERTTDLLVVGSGVAGCAAALAGARAGADVTLATKASRPEDSTSYWAQGGVAVSRGDPEAFKQDIIEASDGIADPEAVDVLVSEADEAVRDVFVDTLDVDFDENGDGPDYCQEAAHSEARILHVDASTGKHVLAPFLNHLQGHERVEVLEDTAALELLTHEGRVHGAMLERDGDWAPCYAGATVLATGGIGACYQRSTNPPTATGDGIAMSALAGADVEDMEYVQFHPTAFAGGDEDAGQGTFLLSEAIRGEGALLRNANDERFMPDYHEDAELAPRDVVARAVKAERERTGEVTLDVSPLDFEGEFPDLHAECENRGVDPTDGIPVAPAEHFLCGGIDVDTKGRSSLDRLFAVGECARTGVHGANRLASTSLLEALVFGLRVGEAAAGFDAERVEAPELLDSDPDLPESFAAEKFVRLRRVLDEFVGIERTPEDLSRAAGVLRRLKGEIDAYTRTRTSRSLYELRSACVSALLVTRAAAENGTSRGCHHIAEEGTTVDAD
ncbi:FAD-dependent oxidoreductase [Natronomonas halophila]|uniref:L-aspartate oxidase n=1 Tax=Natronomonas halophila TaxID=2747817 RepID=UPI0015B5B7ED|nr:FAD-dependent oxidoreductase [Natronomonas halophila]QLD86794.1 FAD-dependent oxidoreductase [Natronomonas halophila]